MRGHPCGLGKEVEGGSPLLQRREKSRTSIDRALHAGENSCFVLRPVRTRAVTIATFEQADLDNWDKCGSYRSYQCDLVGEGNASLE
jgi:hypothetical protein